MLATCNGCDALAPEADENPMGYCATCLKESVQATRSASGGTSGDVATCIPQTNPAAVEMGYTCANTNREHFAVCPDFAILNALAKRRSAPGSREAR